MKPAFEVALFWTFFGLYGKSEAVVTNLSVIQIPSWFFALTPFEAIFVGLTFLWMCLLGLTGILPMNLNNFFYGSPSGRRKRRGVTAQNLTHSSFHHDPLILQSMVEILHKVDRHDCVPLALCELERQVSSHGYVPPEGVSQLLKILEGIEGYNSFEYYTKATRIGRMDLNGTSCSMSYSKCDIVSNRHIVPYVESMHFDDFL